MQRPAAKQRTSLRSCDCQGRLTSQTLPKLGEGYGSRGGEIRPLRGGPGHLCAILFCVFGSWPGMLLAGRRESGREPRDSELDPTCRRLRDDHAFSRGFYTSWPRKRPQRQGTWAHAALGMGESSSEKALSSGLLVS